MNMTGYVPGGRRTLRDLILFSFKSFYTSSQRQYDRCKVHESTVYRSSMSEYINKDRDFKIKVINKSNYKF